MAFISDYLDWRGDLSFQIDPANEVDYYLISKIGCPDLTCLVSAGSRETALTEVVEAYRAKEGNNPLGAAASPQILTSFYRLPMLPRFQPLMLSGFRRTSDFENTEQFSALTIRIPDGHRVVTFRGTDDNIFAWKENFHMSVMETIPAQEDALAYLRWVLDTFDGDVIVCGHSKGGNLAVYASSMLPEELQARIAAVYDFDGPGFQDAFLKNEGYLRILPKVHSLIPKNAIVGMLLSKGNTQEVIACDSFGVKAHDGFTWKVFCNRFVRAEALNPNSARFGKAMAETLSGMSQADREAFIDDFFQIMTSTGALTLTDLTETKLGSALELVRSLGKNKEVQKLALNMITNTIADIRSRRGE
ncbi:MAG: DUF2974 domain-containing protein [Lachnospiraceae bacterium]|nr:DUF2974 domain-containing protein [Lachnospiraceae bacterium]